jgi:signal transduction histidine kinase
MFTRLSLPITLAVVMIALVVVLIVGWVLLAVFGALADPQSGALYWTLLTVGTTFLVALLVGVVMYLMVSIAAINLSRRQSNFVDAVTHELKSPIASLKLYLQTLKRRQVSEDQQAGFYQSMLDDCERLDRLTNQVLDAGRVERPPDSDKWEHVNLAELLEECVDTVCLGYRIPRTAVSLELVPCRLQVSRVNLEMLFRNLIDNAVKYSGSEPQVEVELSVDSRQRAVVRISDNGRGIPAKMRRKIFGRFERLGVELTREKPGTGLGLYIVRSQVRRLKGRIRVSDREPGSGTVFEVWLPGADQEVAVSPRDKRSPGGEEARHQ